MESDSGIFTCPYQRQKVDDREVYEGCSLEYICLAAVLGQQSYLFSRRQVLLVAHQVFRVEPNSLEIIMYFLSSPESLSYQMYGRFAGWSDQLIDEPESREHDDGHEDREARIDPEREHGGDAEPVPEFFTLSELPIILRGEIDAEKRYMGEDKRCFFVFCDTDLRREFLFDVFEREGRESNAGLLSLQCLMQAVS